MTGLEANFWRISIFSF